LNLIPSREAGNVMPKSKLLLVLTSTHALYHTGSYFTENLTVQQSILIISALLPFLVNIKLYLKINKISKPRGPGLVKWDLWWTKRRWGKFSPSTSVSPANLYSSQSPGAGTICQKWPTYRVDTVWTPPLHCANEKKLNF
jgi:hypothetical protein